MKRLLFALALLSLCFAESYVFEATPVSPLIGWQALALIAAFSAFLVILILYLLSYLVDSSEMRLMALHELYQIGFVLVFIALFVILDSYIAGTISGPLAETFGQTNLIGGAKIVSQGISDYEWAQILSFTNGIAIPMGSLASLSGTCSFLGTSYSYPGCIGIQVPFSSANFAVNVMAASLIAQNSQIMLLKLAEIFFFPVILPLGIFLRCFQFTRAAGGFLIAFAVSFYFVYPGAIFVTKGMADLVAMGDPDYPSIEYPDASYDAASLEPKGDCNPFDMDPQYTSDQVDNLMDPGLLDPLLFHFLIGGLFTNMLNLLVALSALRGLGAVFGAEVDVSALERIS